jgi:hypothetical protein
MSGLIKTFEDLPGWTFEMEEVSAGCYLVKGSDKYGRSIEVDGYDPDAMLEECRRYAAEVLGGPRL